MLWKCGNSILCKRLNIYNYLYWPWCCNGAAEAAVIVGKRKAVFMQFSKKCSEIKTTNAVMTQESGIKKKEPPWDACDKINWQSSSQQAWHRDKEKEWLIRKTASIFFPQNLTKQEAYLSDYSNEMYRLNTKHSVKSEQCLFKWHWGNVMVSQTFTSILLT